MLGIHSEDIAHNKNYSRKSLKPPMKYMLLYMPRIYYNVSVVG
jgi:hypothetical protein